ncbi:unnamed protein product [Urochloa humidicola]
MPRGIVPTVAFVLAFIASADSQQAPAPAPAPAGGCTVLLAKVADCLQYITPGSPVSQPSEKCCTEVNSGVKDPAAVACVCDLLGGHTFGLPINLTRAAGLPVACGSPASSLSLCNVLQQHHQLRQRQQVARCQSRHRPSPRSWQASS